MWIRRVKNPRRARRCRKMSYLSNKHKKSLVLVDVCVGDKRAVRLMNITANVKPLVLWSFLENTVSSQMYLIRSFVFECLHVRITRNDAAPFWSMVSVQHVFELVLMFEGFLLLFVTL